MQRIGTLLVGLAVALISVGCRDENDKALGVEREPPRAGQPIGPRTEPDVRGGDPAQMPTVHPPGGQLEEERRYLDTHELENLDAGTQYRFPTDWGAPLGRGERDERRDEAPQAPQAPHAPQAPDTQPGAPAREPTPDFSPDVAPQQPAR